MFQGFLGSVTFTGATGVITNNTGMVTPTAGGPPATSVLRNGAGDYSVTLARPVDQTEAHVHVSAEGAAPFGHGVDWVSDTVIRVRIFNMANPPAAADPTSVKVSIEKTRFRG